MKIKNEFKSNDLNDSAFGRRVRSLRKSKGWTQDHLGELASVTGAAVSAWEKGKAMPPGDKLLEIATLFEVSVGWLMSGQGSPVLDGEDARLSQANVQIQFDWDLLEEVIASLHAQQPGLDPKAFASLAAEACKRSTGPFRRHVDEVVRILLKA